MTSQAGPNQKDHDVLLSREDRLPSRKRRHDDPDLRTEFEKDRDRVLYSSAHRRLGDVTQVVSADHGGSFHNRLTHSQKVAQIGQRLAERLQRDFERRMAADTSAIGLLRSSLSPEVVQAACLGHDLGHPPFGHVGEYTLDDLLRADDLMEGFEGNAQSFRVVTKLALISPEHSGLRLTRATLAGMLKYPWPRDISNDGPHQKFGYYRSEQEFFDHASKLLEESGDLKRPHRPGLEAQLMDLSDDITYSVHDLEDFHRAGLIPWHLIMNPAAEDFRLRLVARASKSKTGASVRTIETLAKAFDRLFGKDKETRPGRTIEGVFLLDMYAAVTREPYDGNARQRIALRRLVADLIDRFMSGVTIEIVTGTPRLRIDQKRSDELRILKEITRNFIHESVALGAQQHGHTEIIKVLYSSFKSDIEGHLAALKKDPGGDLRPLRVVPKRFHHFLEQELRDGGTPTTPVPRLVSDCIASLGESEATALAKRLMGWQGGSAKDAIVF